MTHLTGAERANAIQKMFGEIAPTYDRLNRLMTAGQDIRWRREVIARANLPTGGKLLDLGAGTGDLSFEALRQYPGCRPVAGDFTLAMMQVGRKRTGSEYLDWTGADSLHLPFPAASFDALVSGFLLRNVVDLPAALREQARVLKPGGHWVSLDTTRPVRSIFSPFIRFHMDWLIPAMGRLLSGAGEAYRYLPESSERFLLAEQLAAALVEAGFQQVGFQRLMFGTIAIHWGIR